MRRLGPLQIVLRESADVAGGRWSEDRVVSCGSCYAACTKLTWDMDELTHVDHRMTRRSWRWILSAVERFTATPLVGSKDAGGLLARVTDTVSEHFRGGIVEITAQPRSSGAH
jgi:hypothetical protein